MKKNLFLIIALTVFLCSACSIKINISNVNETKETFALKEAKVPAQIEKQNIVNHMTEREFSFDAKIPFVYNGPNDYISQITAIMVDYSKNLFGDQGTVEIPVPCIVEIDDTDKNDIKVYGDFKIYGYEMFGTIFYTKNGSSNPGCFHLKDEDGEIKFVSYEFAEDGTDNYSSLLKICNDDEELVKEIFGIDEEVETDKRIYYAKMYAEENNLRLSGIKDFGWPIILFDDIDNTEFIYNFYNSYFDEIKQEDYLNDLPERIDNLKSKYFSEELIDKIEKLTDDVGADMVINAQDVTEQMIDTLETYDVGDGYTYVEFEVGENLKNVFRIEIVDIGLPIDTSGIDPSLLKYMNFEQRTQKQIRDIEYIA